MTHLPSPQAACSWVSSRPLPREVPLGSKGREETEGASGLLHLSSWSWERGRVGPTTVGCGAGLGPRLPPVVGHEEPEVSDVSGIFGENDVARELAR